jgi:hypothetical protein
MNFRPVHQNLDTSFVNLSALIKYLRRRQFAGIVRVRLNNYEAEIHITDENQLNIREQDHLSGRVSEGEEALQRILIRSREPGGTVNVFQKVNGKFSEKVAESKDANKPVKVSANPVIIEQKPSSAIVPETKSAAETAIKTPPANQIRPARIELAKIEPPVQKTEVSLPDFPFRLSNNVEAKAKQTKITTEQFQKLVKLFAEILGTIDKSLAASNLNFPAAFAKACSEISNDYPFLKPEENAFHYNKGEIKINAAINPNQFSSSLLEAVRRVMEKLGANPKFSETYRATVQNLLALMRQKKPLYDEFFITSKLEKIIGA